MDESVKLIYKNNRNEDWNEKTEVEVEIKQEMEVEELLTKTVIGVANLFLRLGFEVEDTMSVFIGVGSQILENIYGEEPNDLSSDEDIVAHVKNIDKYNDINKESLTLANFKAELKKEAFIQYLYAMFIEDQEG